MTDETPGLGSSLRNQLFDEAADWFAKMRGPDADLHRPAFEAWLVRGAVHRSAYNRIAEIFTDSGRVEDPDSASNNGKHPPQGRRGALTTIALVIGMAAALATFCLYSRAFTPQATSPERFLAVAPRVPTLGSTVGEIRRIVLADGSSIILDTDSLVSVAFTAQERRLRLIRGRARFEVAHEGRPFRVSAGTGLVTARGTIFDVQLDPRGKVAVILLRGAVDVSLPGTGAIAQQRLHPGEKTEFDDRFEAPQPIPAREANVWMHGQGEFHDVPLSEIVAAANRYSIVPILIPDPQVQKLRISGIFSLRDTQALSAKLATLFDLDRELGPDRITLKRRRPQR
jgi:transmembrane sensor